MTKEAELKPYIHMYTHWYDNEQLSRYQTRFANDLQLINILQTRGARRALTPCAISWQAGLEYMYDRLVVIYMG